MLNVEDAKLKHRYATGDNVDVYSRLNRVRRITCPEENVRSQISVDIPNSSERI